jgi:hypothetical protein
MEIWKYGNGWQISANRCMSWRYEGSGWYEEKKSGLMVRVLNLVIESESVLVFGKAEQSNRR